jgi:hypothetical protein
MRKLNMGPPWLCSVSSHPDGEKSSGFQCLAMNCSACMFLSHPWQKSEKFCNSWPGHLLWFMQWPLTAGSPLPTWGLRSPSCFPAFCFLSQLRLCPEKILSWSGGGLSFKVFLYWLLSFLVPLTVWTVFSETPCFPGAPTQFTHFGQCAFPTPFSVPHNFVSILSVYGGAPSQRERDWERLFVAWGEVTFFRVKPFFPL